MTFTPANWPNNPVALAALADLLGAGRRRAEIVRGKIAAERGLATDEAHAALELKLDLDELFTELNTLTLVKGWRGPGRTNADLAAAFSPMASADYVEQILDVARVSYPDMAGMHDRGEITTDVMTGYVVWWSRNHPGCTAHEGAKADQGPVIEWIAAAIEHAHAGGSLIPAPGHSVWLPEARVTPEVTA